MTDREDCSRSDRPRWSDREVERILEAATGWTRDETRGVVQEWGGRENERDDEAER